MFGWMDELIPDIRDDPVPSLVDAKPNAPLGVAAHMHDVAGADPSMD
jgi:hypothetical protein